MVSGLIDAMTCSQRAGSFNAGDLALFLPTRNPSLQHFAAFNYVSRSPIPEFRRRLNVFPGQTQLLP